MANHEKQPGRHGKRKTSRARFELGPGGAVFLVISSLILGVAIYSQAPMLFWAFGLMVAALIVSFFCSTWMLRNISIRRVPATHGVAGETMILRYQLYNRKKIIPAFGVMICETWGKGSLGWQKTGPLAISPPRLKGRPLGWIAHIGAGQHIQAEAPCWPLRRGYLPLQKVQVSTAFPFGIIRRIREFEIPGEVLIYPKLIRIDRKILFKLSDMDPFGRERIDKGGGHEEFYGLREYRPGDSLKMIDWKRSARTSQLVSREMTQPSPPKIMVALDLTNAVISPLMRSDEKKYAAEIHDITQRIEKAISMTASLVCDAYFNGYQIGLAVLGVPITPFPVHHSLPHRTRILEALAQLDTTNISPNAGHLPARPSVIIRPTLSENDKPVDANQQVIDAGDIQQYGVQLHDASGSMLESRSAQRSRRQQVQEARAWG